MKKLMVALVTVAVGMMANAASYNWSADSGRLFNGTGGTGSANYITSGTAYLLFTSDLTQSALVTAYAADAATAASTVSTKAVSTGSVGSDARIASSSFTADKTTDQTAYFVVFNGDKMYVSITADAGYMAVGASTIAFDSLSASSKLSFDSASGYSAAGWYTQSVPEPTSGLLMLLGMAGLALRRRRA